MTVACPFCGTETSFLTCKGTARLLGLSPRTIRKYLAQGRFPGATKVHNEMSRGEWKIPTTAVLPLLGEDL